ncbi:MAG TPA: hypothetical protein VMT29_03495 [Steroidobacteraceae bacterium]|nr:hypothetical protein [Steroidobacteraceae bacterium]
MAEKADGTLHLDDLAVGQRIMGEAFLRRGAMFLQINPPGDQ